MAAPKKKPEDRTGAARGFEDDPRFLTIAKGHSMRDGIPIPQANPKWRPSARSWFNSLSMSGQSEFFEASDWATAVAAAEAYNVFLITYSASIFAQFVKLSERLAVTVVDRKKSRIELANVEPDDEDEDAADEAITGWQGRLHAVDD
jgi:hypothetical protein